jgi:hypothetical protein
LATTINLCKAEESLKVTAKKYRLAYATLYRHVKPGSANRNNDDFVSIDRHRQNCDIIYPKSTGAQWLRGQYARSAIAEVKQRSQRSVVMGDQKFLIFAELRKAR